MAISLDRFIGQAETLQQLKAHAARLSRLESQLQAALPTPLAASCHVANLRDGDLVVHADSGAAAAKLRQSLPSLVAALQAAGAPVGTIRVRVKPVEYRPAPAAAPTREVSASTLQHLAALTHALPADSPLAGALQRFLRRSA